MASDELWRYEAIKKLQNHYPEFADFMKDGMNRILGFESSTVQDDVSHYLQHGPKLRMIQAFRGLGKSTVTSLYALWRWIHDPREIILLVCATRDNAEELVIGVSQILFTWEILECLRPGPGDRAGSFTLDIHKSLKGVNKSPSLNALSVTGSLQSKRASILIADDVESAKNSYTAGERSKVLAATRELSSICREGDIIYLGTPQLSESLYNTLPGRGFDLRIWPARVPTEKELPNYGDFLAPMVRAMYDEGEYNRTGYGINKNRGIAVDPIMGSDDLNLNKERDQEAGYQLQFMLDTTLSDLERFPLRLSDLVITDVGKDHFPDSLTVGNAASSRFKSSYIGNEELFTPTVTAPTMSKYRQKILYLDPAGGGKSGDDFVGVVMYAVQEYFCVPDILQLRGGSTIDNMEAMAKFAVEYKVDVIYIESNYGGNAVVNMMHAQLQGLQARIGVVGDHASGNKEKRILERLTPVLRQRRLVISPTALESNFNHGAGFPPAQRQQYDLLFQIKRMSLLKDALLHDDSVDALASALGVLIDASRASDVKTLEVMQQERAVQWFIDRGMKTHSKPKRKQAIGIQR